MSVVSRDVEPLVVSVVDARRMLGGIGHNQFWELVKAGELDLVGSKYKRWVVVASIRARVDRMIAAADAARQPKPEPEPAPKARATRPRKPKAQHQPAA